MLIRSTHRTIRIVALFLCIPLLLPTVLRGAEPSFTELEFHSNLFADHDRRVLFLDQVAQEPPTLDGKLDDACWSKAAVFEGLEQLESGLPAPADIATRGMIVRGQDGLYIAIDARRAPLPPAFEDGSGAVDPSHPELANQGLDQFALLFNPDIQDFTRYRFIIGKDGVRAALRHFLIPPWKPEGWKAVYHPTDDRIIIECFIPYALLRGSAVNDGDVIAFNLHRYTHSYIPVPAGPYRYQVGEHYVWSSARCHSMETVDHHPWLYFGRKENYLAHPPAPVVRVYLDKKAYDRLDEAAEAYIEVRSEERETQSMTLALELLNEAGEVILARPPQALDTPDVGVGFYPQSLKPGTYTLKAIVRQGEVLLKESTRSFTMLETTPKVASKPEWIDLVLTDHADIGTGIRPISTAITFPRGMMTDEDLVNLRVERRVIKPNQPLGSYDHTWEQVDAGFTVRNRWYRDGSIRWLGVDFQAEYYRGRQRAVIYPDHPLYPTYRLNLNHAAAPPANRLKVLDADEEITIDTGPMKAVVSKTDFRLLSSAWLDANGDGVFDDGEKMIASGKDDGLSASVNEGASIFATGKAVKVWVQEANDLRAIIVAQGDYLQDGQLAGQHLTRLFFERDQPTVKIHHTYIITGDTNQEVISNVAIRVGIPQVSGYRFSSDAGDLVEGRTKQNASTYLLQTSHDRYVIEQEKTGSQVGQELHRGGRTAGWVTAITSNGGVQLAGRRLWQLFPKELEVGSNFLALHSWPRHGREVFDDDELFSPLGVVQARFAHHGRSMNIRTPLAAYQTMGKAYNDTLAQTQYDKVVGPYSSGYIFDYAEEAWNANGQGIALTTELCIRLMTPAQTDAPDSQASFATSYQANPMAVADPKWTYESRVLGELWPRDETRFGTAELAIDRRFKQVFIDLTDRLGDYGSLIWPDYHTYAESYYTGTFEPKWFHRSWIGTHYQEGRTFYLLFLRSGLDMYWRHARDSTRHKMDINTVNYASDPRVGKNQTPWGGYHVYGVLPWAGMQGISCHYQNLDYKTWDSFVTGDPRGLMQARGWAREMARSTWANEPSRDALVPLSEALEVYQATHYAPLLKTIHWFQEACLSVPIEQFILPHFSQMGWWRMHHYTRDPRVAQRLIEQWGDGNQAKRNGLGQAITIGLIYRLTGDERLASLMTFQPPYRAPYLPQIGPPHISRTMMNLPYAMSVLSEFQAGGDQIGDYDTYENFWKPRVEQWTTQGKKRFGH